MPSGISPARRRFLSVAVAGLASTAMPMAAELACATGSRSSSTRSLPSVRGLQLYTLRAQMAQSVERTLARVAATGYRQVEFAGFFGRAPSTLRRLLGNLGLAAPAAHFPVEEMEADMSAVVGQARALGSRYVVLPWLDPSRRNIGYYRQLPDKLNRWGRMCRDAGLRLAYHNHDFEFVDAKGALPYRLLLDGTDPELVYFEMDLYWMHRAGQAPQSYFDRYPGRFPLWHLKDATAAGAMTEVGQGVIDFPRLLAQADRAGLEYGFVERDDAEDPLSSIRTSLAGVNMWKS
ncbi:sugar phosphate isomerase/epimerase family protein [Microbulbifer marinus]|uniref:Sugar phosphate isomerase/epimerase n=1 Tax=Microbulbifer marinus TaxID=658218 RepID=A0A1H3YC17_9GAMM|nr:sugar phosphate isomerase/epimerase [Microbulbifer marinus]SEA09147.1 Sugar phosphate isomerase/epimerase [Microbulbifer marinus]